MQNKEKLATLIPLEELESEALDQIERALGWDFLKKLVIQPDCHTGYDLPIGGVALLSGVVSPSYVGYDVGCGVVFVETDKSIFDVCHAGLQAWYDRIKETIPNGQGRENQTPRSFKEFPNASGDKELADKVGPKIGAQLGTLGAGNHFIEVGVSREDKLCVTIHSGSRNPGHSVGGYYMKKSKIVDTDLPPGFLHLDSETGKAYLTDMNYMLEYALENRKLMMLEILKIMGYSEFESFRFVKECMINENHNHAVVTPDGVLHRKGATPADKDQLGVIPGNMSNGVVITRGLGNAEFLCSASHGAGRRMSRTKAKATIDPKRFEEQMVGIVASTNSSLLDEAPDAYKDLELVIKRQKGIVIDVVDLIKPVVNVKGEGRSRRRKESCGN